MFSLVRNILENAGYTIIKASHFCLWQLCEMKFTKIARFEGNRSVTTTIQQRNKRLPNLTTIIKMYILTNNNGAKIL